jgi:hypothetical protein
MCSRVHSTARRLKLYPSESFILQNQSQHSDKIWFWRFYISRYENFDIFLGCAFDLLFLHDEALQIKAVGKQNRTFTKMDNSFHQTDIFLYVYSCLPTRATCNCHTFLHFMSTGEVIKRKTSGNFLLPPVQWVKCLSPECKAAGASTTEVRKRVDLYPNPRSCLHDMF